MSEPVIFSTQKCASSVSPLVELSSSMWISHACGVLLAVPHVLLVHAPGCPGIGQSDPGDFAAAADPRIEFVVAVSLGGFDAENVRSQPTGASTLSA
ncbi:MAG TPA: hypothetical protein VGF45_16735 [Polyangia bacterium]